MRNAAAQTEGQMPERFGRYVLIDRVGSGGMAEVYRAVTFGTSNFRRIIVVKRIRRELSESASFLQMFFDEAKISALLHHKNIVQVYDFGQVYGHYFLAMEYLEGKDVATILRTLRPSRRGLAPSLVAAVGYEIAQGLQYVHTLRSADDRPFDIIHRDVNPANVMLLRTGGVKLLDFGIAKASDVAGKSQTQRAILKGKLSYLSPEQANCEKLDGRSDLFSWGATMWEMLTGTRLFGGKSDYDRVTAVKQAPVPPPSERQPHIPQALDRIVLRALERDVSRRYQSAEELGEDLVAFLKFFPPAPDAVSGLLTELFGEETSTGIAVPPLEVLMAAPERPWTGKHLTGEHYAPTSSEISRAPGEPEDSDDPTNLDPPPEAQRPQEPRRPRPALVWVAGAALGVAAVAAVSVALLTRHTPAQDLASTPSEGAARPATGPGDRAGTLAGAQGGPLVKIEIDSEPSGARVSGPRGLLGTTPLQLDLPASAESEALLFEKPGFEPTTYELRPQRAGMVFVELRRAPP